jgi:hypothetical protein
LTAEDPRTALDLGIGPESPGDWASIESVELGPSRIRDPAADLVDRR